MVVLLVASLARAEEKESEDDVKGPGVMFRADHIEGQGIPQVDSITPLQLFPYVLTEDSLFFSDLRFYSTNEAMLGGNAGIGYRYFSSTLDSVFGISGWYDGDNTRELYFQQAGLSLEAYSWLLDVRANFYLPVGDTDQQHSLSLVNGSTRFVGSGVQYDTIRSSFVAMKGVDGEIGVPLPTEFAKQHGLRIYGGAYAYNDERDNTINGWSGRLQANLFEGLDAQVQVTHDDFYETRAFAGISWTFGRLHRSQLKRSTAYGRIGEHVTRNYTVLAPLRDRLEHLLAVDPATGDPYEVAHVIGVAALVVPGFNAYPNLDAAQATAPDIIFVHAGLTIDNAPTIALAPGQRLLGDGNGVQHHVLVPEVGPMLLPQGGGLRPAINGSLGDAVQLASLSEFSGFTIAGAAGRGIVGQNVANAAVRNVIIDGTGGDGMLLFNSTGSMSIANVVVSNTAGRGIALEGGSATTTFSGPITTSNTAGAAVSIEGLTTKGAVHFENLGIHHRLDRGLEIENVAGQVTVSGRANIANEAGSAASAIDIRNSSGTFDLARADVADATGAPAVNLQNNTGASKFGTLNIRSQNGTALRAVGAGRLTVNPAVEETLDPTIGGLIVAVDGAAIDIQNTALDINFTSISSSNALRGITLVDTTGRFAVLGGTTAAGAGGLIENAGTGVFLKNTGLTILQAMKLDANGIGMYSENSKDVFFVHSTLEDSASFGIDSLNTLRMNIGNSVFTGNGAANLRGQFDQAGSYAYSIASTTWKSSTADNIVIASAGGAIGATMNFLVQEGTFENSLAGATAINVNWNGVLSAAANEVTITGTGGSNTGMAVYNASATGLSSIALANSGFKGTGGNDTAFRLTTLSPNQVALTSNTVEFAAAQGTGFRLALGSSSAVGITSNHIFDAVDGTTGILFESIAGTSSVAIGNNLIDLKNQGPLLDRGIIFSGVTNKIELLGDTNNTINNANTPFFIPAGTSTGSIFVNGARVP